jgi:glycosyltransferase involved in cell wall biosynthesis
LGIRKDVESILPALDIGCLSSITEGFPNSICEFMASGVPCVVTDVGDAALIVGDAGIVVAKSDPVVLGKGLISLLKLTLSERVVLGQRARARIIEEYNLSRMVGTIEKLLESLLIKRE